MLSTQVEVDLLRWCLDAVVAANGAVYGDQDLLNLIIGRRDIDVRYLHPRFNVQLAYPARQKDAFMDPPWCGYGPAQFAAGGPAWPTLASRAQLGPCLARLAQPGQAGPA